MRRVTVRKGLEQPVIIKGMQARHYWMFVIIMAGAGMITVLAFYAAISDSLAWSAFFMQTCAAGGGILVIRRIFLNQARVKRFNFRKQESTLSNRDLLQYL